MQENQLDAYGDWVPFVEEVINKYKVKSVLEFGMGMNTKLFLDKCESVVSVELLANPDLAEWYKVCQSFYEKYTNWKPYLFKCMDDITKGTTKAYCAAAIKRVKPDLVFVDPGVHFRGDLVNLAMKYEVGLIVAHDTRCGFEEDDIYGWNKINTEGYETEARHEGQGTTLWRKI